MRSERRCVTEPVEWWRAFGKQADAEGVSLSEWLGACGLANLPAAVVETLPDRPPVGAPKKNKEEGCCHDD